MTEEKWGIPREDWESNTAETPLIIAVVVIAPTLSFVFNHAIFVITALIAFTVFLLAREPSIWYYVFRFPGAYLHHHFKDPFKERL